jgi:hypothetical protein
MPLPGVLFVVLQLVALRLAHRGMALVYKKCEEK